ncbi:MAG: transcriptional regulator [Chloroflexota bacterium]
MLIPCEVAVKIVLPCIRALMANELMSRYHLKQAEAAKKLEISQAAISMYQKKLRGNSINLENDAEIKSLVTKYVGSLMNNSLNPKQKVGSVCEICKIIRFKGYLCHIHKNLDPKIDVKNCNFCKSSYLLVCP